MTKFVHQGDIPFHPFEGKITGNKVKHDGSIVLALGEKTGHKHVISVIDHNDMQAWKQLEGGWVITLKTEGTLVHNQHGPLTIAPGTYRIGQEREVDWFLEGITRKVID